MCAGAKIRRKLYIFFGSAVLLAGCSIGAEFGGRPDFIPIPQRGIKDISVRGSQCIRDFFGPKAVIEPDDRVYADSVEVTITQVRGRAIQNGWEWEKIYVNLTLAEGPPKRVKVDVTGFLAPGSRFLLLGSGVNPPPDSEYKTAIDIGSSGKLQRRLATALENFINDGTKVCRDETTYKS